MLDSGELTPNRRSFSSSSFWFYGFHTYCMVCSVLIISFVLQQSSDEATISCPCKTTNEDKGRIRGIKQSIYFGHNCCNMLIQLYMVRVDFSAFCAVVLLGYISHLVIVLKNIVFIVHMT